MYLVSLYTGPRLLYQHAFQRLVLLSTDVVQVVCRFVYAATDENQRKGYCT